MRPWVSVRLVFSLSLGTLSVLGERAGVRGQDRALLPNSRFEQRSLWGTTKREALQLATNDPPLPASPPESPAFGRFGGEEKIARNS